MLFLILVICPFDKLLIGFDAALFMVNLFLYENKSLLDAKKRDLRQTRLFSNVFHFIDALWSISNLREFDRNFKNIHPSELQLKKENILTSEASFLDLSIITENKKFKTQLCDKRNTFSFSIVCMPHLDRNMPLNIFTIHL